MAFPGLGEASSWTDKRWTIPAGLQPILERLNLNAEAWVESVTHLARRFHRAIAGR